MRCTEENGFDLTIALNPTWDQLLRPEKSIVNPQSNRTSWETISDFKFSNISKSFDLKQDISTSENSANKLLHLQVKTKISL